MTNETRKIVTTTSGEPYPSDEHSLTVGQDGPIVMHDHFLMEQMAAFNREMIPDRQPHAKGGGAFGHFEVTGDVSRSEEHTSELQSRFDLVCRLLLEKKK